MTAAMTAAVSPQRMICAAPWCQSFDRSPEMRSSPETPRAPTVRTTLRGVARAGLIWLALVSFPAIAQEPKPAGNAGPELSPAATAALERLIGPGAAASVRGQAPAGGHRETLVVRRGDTLDTVIRRAGRDLPFRDDIVRKAFVTLNPDAFMQGSPHRLNAGASLRVPTTEDVLVMLNLVPSRAQPTGSTMHSAGSAGGAPGAYPPGAVAHAPDPQAMERRRWIRYP